MIKSFAAYKLPSEYENQLYAYFDDVKQILGPKLQFFMLFGSCGLGNCIPDWSDIDILVIVDNLNFMLLNRLQRAQQKYRIKIALTVLTLRELDSRMIDGKMKVAFYQFDEGLLAMNYVNSDSGIFMVPRISLHDIQIDDSYRLPEYLHKLRRALCAPDGNKRTIIKLAYLVEKIKLRSPGHNIVATSYCEACECFTEEFAMPELCFEAEIKRDGAISREFLDDAKELVRKICNGEI